MEQQELIKRAEEKFKETKHELGFKASFEELDKVFFIRDGVMKAGFVSDNFSRQICARIVESLMSWNNYLHGLIMPNPQNLLNFTESKSVKTEEERKQITKIMKRAMAFASTNTLVGLTKNRKEEAEFIDESLKFWNEEFSPILTVIMKKVNDNWKD